MKLVDPPYEQRRDLRELLNEESKVEHVKISTFAEPAGSCLIEIEGSLKTL